MGGKFQDYINIILNMPCKSSVQEIIENLIAEGDINQEQKEVRNEKKVEEVKGVAMEKLFEEPKKILKKRFSESIKKKAREIAEVLGESAELYYGICDAYCLSQVNELIEIILNDPEMIAKFSSYKN